MTRRMPDPAGLVCLPKDVGGCREHQVMSAWRISWLDATTSALATAWLGYSFGMRREREKAVAGGLNTADVCAEEPSVCAPKPRLSALL